MFRNESLFIGTSFTEVVFAIFATLNVNSIVDIPHKIYSNSGLNNSIGPIALNCPKWPSGNHICGPKLPAKLVFWKFGQQTFSCANHCSTHCTPYALFILRGVVQSDCHLVLNQLLFMISMISFPLYLIWFYDQLIIEPWYESSMT